MKTFLGKSELCNMTSMSGAFDERVFDGIINLLKINEENDKHRYVYIGRDMICYLLTDDDISQYISKMENNITPYSIAIGEENIFFF